MHLKSLDPRNLQKLKSKKILGRVKTSIYSAPFSVLQDIKKIAETGENTTFHAHILDEDDVEYVVYQEGEETDQEHRARLQGLRRQDCNDFVNVLLNYNSCVFQKTELRLIFDEFKKIFSDRSEMVERFLLELDVEELIAEAYDKGKADAQKDNDNLRGKLKELANG